MKKFGIFILLLATFALTACNSGYTSKIRLPWRDAKETLTYEISVLPDSDYNYAPSYNNVDYSAKPDKDLSGGTYTTSIEKTGDGEYTVTTEFYFLAVYAKEGFPAGNWDTVTVDSVEYVYFENTITTEAAFSGSQGSPFQKMLYSKKTYNTTEVTKRKVDGTPRYNEPAKYEYTLRADYTNGNYNYKFLNPDNTPFNTFSDLYDIAQNGSFSAGGIDNEVLFYYIRSVEMTTDNYSSVSASVSVPDAYLGKISALTYSYADRVNIKKPDGITEYQFEGENYNCVQISLYGSGDRAGHGISLYYALNDSLSMSIAGYPSRREQKLIRMKQTYLQYDLTGRA